MYLSDGASVCATDARNADVRTYAGVSDTNARMGSLHSEAGHPSDGGHRAERLAPRSQLDRGDAQSAPAADGLGRTRIDTGTNVPLAWRMSAKVKVPFSFVIREFGRNTTSP